MTIPRAFFEAGRAIDREEPSVLTRTSGPAEGELLNTISRGGLELRVRELALGLLALGIGPGNRIAVLLENGPDWIISDLAVSSVGAITVPVYTTLTAKDVLYILKDSSSRAVIFSSGHLKKVLQAKKELDFLEHLICTEAVDEAEAPSGSVLTLEDLTALGRESGDEALLEDRLKGIKDEDPFSIIYTSGTTGLPKGVVLSHGNILSNIESVLKVIEITKKDLYLSYLPLSHIFERMVHHLLILRGATVAYSRGFAYVGADISFFSPTIMTGVPFFFDRVRGRIIENIEKGGFIKRFLFDRAVKARSTKGAPLFYRNILDRMVLKRIRVKIGPNLRFFISGGAALSVETARFFQALGIPVIEGYGLTETSPVVSVNTLEDNRIGTVGRPVPGVDVRIDEDGEILVRGHSVMQGYINMSEATREAIRDGWFHTGDSGYIDRDGFLTITGRKKDIIITSVGKNVSPQKIETVLRADAYIKEALVYGDGRPHLVALIVPDKEKLKSIVTVPEDEILKNKDVRRFFEKRIHGKLRVLPRFEQVRDFALIEDNLTVEGGDLTPTMKVKREIVAGKYKEVIDGLYEG